MLCYAILCYAMLCYVVVTVVCFIHPALVFSFSSLRVA